MATTQLKLFDWTATHDGSDRTLRGTGEPVPVTRAEAALIEKRPAQVIEAAQAIIDEADLAEAVSPSGVTTKAWIAPGAALAEHRARLRAGTSVLLDTTTVRNAVAAVGRDVPPSAIELLDLNTMTVAAICFERVVIQPDVRATDPRTGSPIDDIHLPLSTGDWVDVPSLDQRQRGDLEVLHERAAAIVRSPAQARRWAVDWARFLGRDPNDISVDTGPHLDPRNVDAYWDSDQLEERFFSADEITQGSDASRFLGTQTFRTCFNDIVAGHLRIPYMASVMRAPVYNELHESKRKLLNVSARLLPMLSASSAATQRKARQVKVPFLLGRVLSQMSSPDEYWGEVKRLRRECAPVRALVASQTPATADELASMLQRCADNYVSVPGFTDALLNFGMKVSTADPTAATAGLKLWTSFRSVPVVRDALLKRRHPGLFALFRLGTEGKTMAALEDQVTSVWGKAPKSHTAGDLVRIGEFQAYGFQQPVRI